MCRVRVALVGFAGFPKGRNRGWCAHGIRPAGVSNAIVTLSQEELEIASNSEETNVSGKALYRGLRDSLFCGLFIIIIGLSPLRAQITEYAVPANSLFNGLSGIAAGPDGAMWFSGNRNIGRITTAGVITVYPVPTSNDTSYSITTGPDGAMWFTETPLNSGGPFAKIGRITMSGAITEYPLPDPMSIPSAITAGPDGALWFIESGNGKIGRITTSGTITEFPLPASEVNYGAYGITAGPDGNLWYTEFYGADKIVRMTTSGVFTVYNVANFVNSGSFGITVGPDGALWFAEAAFKIGRITTSGTITEYALPANDSPFGIAAGPDGALWFTDSLGQIGRITTSGTVTSLVPTPTNTAGGFLSYIAAGSRRRNVVYGTGRKDRTHFDWRDNHASDHYGGRQCGRRNSYHRAEHMGLIKGSNLAHSGDTRIWQGSDFPNGQMPMQLDGVSATVNGKAAYIYYISPTQVNILTPPDAIQDPVQTQLTNNGVASAAVTAQAQPLSPSFFVFSGGYVIATHLGGSLIGPPTLYPGASTPAKPGEEVVIYANGFGPTDTPVISGSISQSGNLSPLPVIQIGGVTAKVIFAGLVVPGEYQFNVIFPSTVGNGDQPITATYGGASTQSGTLITVHN